jgi:carotenoid 1,2-hydratase
VQVFENTPFYVRDLVESSLGGRVGLAVHESLDAIRLASWPIRMMLPFRMPRWTGSHPLPRAQEGVEES